MKEYERLLARGILVGASLGVGACARTVPSVEPVPAASADRIGFEEVEPGTPLTFQTLLQGVQITSDVPLEVADVEAPAGALASEDRVLLAPQGNSAVELHLLSPRRSLSLRIGNLLGQAQAALTGYDQEGRIVAQASSQGAERGDEVELRIEAAGAVLHRARLDVRGAQRPVSVDDIVLRPPHEHAVDIERYRAVLLSRNTTPQERLTAIKGAQLRPSRKVSGLLQEVARSDADAYVRERAIMTLGTVPDPGAIPLLAQLARDSLDSGVRMAARNTLWQLRRLFPLSDPPEIDIEASGPIRVGAEFEVAITARFPAARPHALVFFQPAKLFTTGRETQHRHKGAVRAGQVIRLRKMFATDEPGSGVIWAVVHVSADAVDGAVYRVPLYIDVRADGGEASRTPPADFEQPVEHVVPRNRR